MQGNFYPLQDSLELTTTGCYGPMFSICTCRTIKDYKERCIEFPLSDEKKM